MNLFFYNGLINLKRFDSNWIKIDKNNCKNIDIYYNRYITIKKIDYYESIHSVNPLYFLINHANVYIKQKEMEINTWFLTILVMKYNEVWDEIKNKIKTINSGEWNSVEENDYEKDFIKIKFNLNDDLPLSKPLNFHAMTIIIRSIFEEDGRLYPQFF